MLNYKDKLNKSKKPAQPKSNKTVNIIGTAIVLVAVAMVAMFVMGLVQ